MPRAVNSSFNWTYSHHYIHKENDLSREIHSVFSPAAYDALETLDKSNANISYPSEDGGMIYVFDYPNAGYQGGSAGTGQTLNHIRVVVNNCGNVITAYPFNQIIENHKGYNALLILELIANKSSSTLEHYN